MIRRGLELRYERSPQAVDPDEYIEKTISLSFDLPQLQPEQAQDLLLSAGLSTLEVRDKPDPWHETIIAVLGTNPRRLKRVANSLRVTRALATQHGTLSEADAKLLLKLGLIAYRNSGAFDLMRRDPKLAVSLQRLANVSRNTGAPAAAELPGLLRGLVDDNGFWDLLRLEPDLTDTGIRRGTAWFQPQ